MIGQQFQAFAIGQAPIGDDESRFALFYFFAGFTERAHTVDLEFGFLIYEGALDQLRMGVFIFNQ